MSKMPQQMGDILKQQVHINRRNLPETQIHVAAQLVQPGEFFHIDPKMQKDKVEEICQFAGRFPPGATGKLTMAGIDKCFDDLKAEVVKRFRHRGLMKAGQ